MHVFYCDIEGTITEGNLETLVNYLNKIIEKDNLDKLYFSFITSNPIEDVNAYLKSLIPLIKETKIVLGTQFCDKYKIDINGNITENTSIAKADQISDDINEKNPNFVYYADDQLMNALVATAVMKVKYPNIKFTTFTPGTFLNEPNSYGSEQKGMNGLIEIIDKYSNVKKI